MTAVRPSGVVVADVSGVYDKSPRIEVHRLGGAQDGSRLLPDSGSTLGLGVTACGIEQATRGHGWFGLDPANDYQQRHAADGTWPRCPVCLPDGADEPDGPGQPGKNGGEESGLIGSRPACCRPRRPSDARQPKTAPVSRHAGERTDG